MSNYDYDCWGGPDGRCGVHKVPYVGWSAESGRDCAASVGDAGTGSCRGDDQVRDALHPVLHHRTPRTVWVTATRRWDRRSQRPHSDSCRTKRQPRWAQHRADKRMLRRGRRVKREWT